MGKKKKNKKQKQKKEINIHPSDKVMLERRKYLFHHPTIAEKEVMLYLKDNNIDFIFQYIVCRYYITDFYIPSKNLCIEVDGGYHKRFDQMEKDSKRQCIMEHNGYSVERMNNGDFKKLKRILERHSLPVCA